MNQTQALRDVTVALQTWEPGMDGNHMLVLLNGKIFLQPKKFTAEAATPIIELTPYDLKNGLKSRDWYYIEGRIRQFRKEGLL